MLFWLNSAEFGSLERSASGTSNVSRETIQPRCVAVRFHPQFQPACARQDVPEVQLSALAYPHSYPQVPTMLCTFLSTALTSDKGSRRWRTLAPRPACETKLASASLPGNCQSSTLNYASSDKPGTTAYDRGRPWADGGPKAGLHPHTELSRQKHVFPFKVSAGRSLDAGGILTMGYGEMATQSSIESISEARSCAYAIGQMPERTHDRHPLEW
ncbi:hypothetical protein JOE31_000300 [Arthrobacter sp. PvP023]|nr:hypothetical protein [Arthrobacter sp. PvP023]